MEEAEEAFLFLARERRGACGLYVVALKASVFFFFSLTKELSVRPCVWLAGHLM